ncbi:aminotransferase class I/II-fold pyridoxal phosphate-dependent enzyme, partial [bacterium]|nr:aminotransferase class I/II-fold pyridoxal phosphate-dependent enzyme [bacterium]
YLRNKLKEAGFKPLDGDGAIVPILVGDDAFAISISNKLLKKGLFVTGFGFPVVPRGTARIRCQVSDALELKDLDWAVEQFKEVGKEVGLI